LEREELEGRIAALGSWHYEFEFESGVKTPVPDRKKINRHEQRRRYFFEALLQVTGGSLRGRRVLDLGSNAGFWALHAIDAGADFVLGVDGRQVHVDQANLVFEAKGVDPARYRFEQGNIFEHDFTESFDVVLCLGLMYHISKPVELFEVMANSGAEIIVIDTNVFPSRFSFFKVSHESVETPLNAYDYELLLVPTRQALSDLARQFGYETAPLALNLTDTRGMQDYVARRRLAFICSNKASLDSLAKEKRPPFAPPITPFVAKRARAGLAHVRTLIP
jgi:tRNA (mo5U34)-methyltransferase